MPVAAGARGLPTVENEQHEDPAAKRNHELAAGEVFGVYRIQSVSAKEGWEKSILPSRSTRFIGKWR
jgi:hypothetical protein